MLKTFGVSLTRKAYAILRGQRAFSFEAPRIASLNQDNEKVITDDKTITDDRIITDDKTITDDRTITYDKTITYCLPFKIEAEIQ